MSGSGTTISNLPPAASALLTDLVPVVEVGGTNVTKRATIQQILNAFTSGPVTIAGDLTLQGHLLMPNNTPIQIQDNAGTYHNILSTGTDNNTHITGGAGGNIDLDTTVFVAGSLNTGSDFTSGDDVYCTDVLHINPANTWEWQFYVDGSGNHYQQHRGTGWSDLWSTSTGTREWLAPSGALMILDPSGNLSVTGAIAGGALSVTSVTANSLQTVNNVIAGVGVYANNSTTFGIFPSGPNAYFQFAPSYYWLWAGSTGALNWTIPAGTLWNLNPTTNQAGNPIGPVFGNGAYSNISDERAKRDITPASVGLAEVLKLEPIDFVRIAGDRGDTGFSAQQVREVIPKAVTDLGEYGLGVADTAIVAALVNAVKELAAEVASLKAARP